MRRLVLPLLALVITAGCAVGAEDDAHGIDVTVASGVFDGPSRGPATSDANSVALSLYLVRDNRLVHVTREASPAGSQVAAVVATAVAGPSAPEARAGLWSAVPPATLVQGVEVSDSVATIDFSSGFAAIGGRDEILAVAQIVLSVTALPEADAVSFRLDGVAMRVPGPDGVLQARPLTGADFLDLIEP